MKISIYRKSNFLSNIFIRKYGSIPTTISVLSLLSLCGCGQSPTPNEPPASMLQMQSQEAARSIENFSREDILALTNLSVNSSNFQWLIHNSGQLNKKTELTPVIEGAIDNMDLFKFLNGLKSGASANRYIAIDSASKIEACDLFSDSKIKSLFPTINFSNSSGLKKMSALKKLKGIQLLDLVKYSQSTINSLSHITINSLEKINYGKNSNARFIEIAKMPAIRIILFSQYTNTLNRLNSVAIKELNKIKTPVRLRKVLEILDRVSTSELSDYQLIKDIVALANIDQLPDINNAKAKSAYFFDNVTSTNKKPITKYMVGELLKHAKGTQFLPMYKTYVNGLK